MKLSTKLLITLLLLIVNISFSQIEKDTLVAYQYYKKADSLLTARQYEESITLFEKALPLYINVKEWEQVVSCYNKLSENLWRSHFSEKSISYAEKAIITCNSYLDKEHLEKAYAYDNIGKYHEKKADYDKSRIYYEKSLNIRKKLLVKNHPDIARSYENLSDFYYYTEKHQRAIEYCKKALIIYLKKFHSKHLKIGNIYNKLASSYVVLGENDKALDFFKKSLATRVENFGENHMYSAYVYSNMGTAYYAIKQLDDALNYYKKAELIFKKENSISALCYLYINIGIIYIEQEEVDKALRYYKESLNLTQKLYGFNHPDVARIYVNLAIIYSENYGDNENSLLYNEKALKIYKNTFGESHYQVATIYNNLGNINLRERNYKKAFSYFQKCLKIQESIFDENHPNIAKCYISIGNFYRGKNLYNKSLDNYLKALNILEKSPNQHLDLLSGVFNHIGEIYYKQQKYLKSLSSYENALIHNTKTEYLKVYKKTINLDHYNDLNRLFDTFLGSAKTLLTAYEKNKIIKNLNESLSLYTNLDMLTDHFRLSYQDHQDKVKLAEKTKEMYMDAIKACFTKNEATNDNFWLEKARYYSEKSKSNILKNLLSDNRAKKFSRLPEKLIALENDLKSDKAFYQSRIKVSQIKDSINVETIQEYESKLFDVTRKQDSLTELLEKEYPKYYQFKHDTKVISVSEIQEKLNTKTTVLEFFTSDSITYAFIISKNKFTIKELQTSKLDEKIKDFREATISKDAASYKQLANTLYNSLINPVKEELIGDELIIIPDGLLWQLNFDLLLTKKIEAETPSELPYLLKDYAITYANSATLYFNPFQETQQKERQQGVLAFSFSDSTNVVNTKNISLARLRGVAEDLPGTRKEIRAIADIIDGQYYFGEDSDEANFKKNASNYKILHLALHGDVDNERPQNSKLYFTKSNDTIEDSYLYGHELFALNIPSELTVLSACNTGTGKIAKGEGIMSLGHAFQYAGTKSLLLSSWEVPDETTPELMKYFYTNLKEGMSKSKALQQAKLQYLEQADIYKAAPFYWGGFYLVGDNAPIDFGTNPLWYWVIGIITVLILMLFIYKKRKI